MRDWLVEDAFTKPARASSDTSSIRLILDHASLDRIALGLVLLSENLIQRLVLTDSASNIRAYFLPNQASSESIVIHTDQLVEISLSEDAYETLLFFTLRTIRDGTPEVDHIDFDVLVSNQKNVSTYLTIVFPNPAPSLPAEQARRMLNL